jgi:PPOX class probable F420-dependent enzyme
VTPDLSIPASHRDLLDAKFATLGTIGPDGRPQLTVVWFLAEDGVVRVSLASSRQKTSNLRRNSVASLLILDVDNPFRYVEVRGDVDIEPDPDYAFAARVGAKYDADLRQFDEPGETRFVVTLRPTRLHAVDMSG